MSDTTPRTTYWLCSATLAFSLLAGCDGESKVQPAEPAPVSEEPAPTPPPKPVREVQPSMQARVSQEAPFACDTLTPEEVGAIVGVETESLDWSQTRREEGTWTDSTCLYAYGENRDPNRLNLKSKFIRVDVYTEASLQAAGWGALHDQWMTRTQWNERRFPFHDGAWAAWVESDHPPDPALLIRQGELMFEIAHYPPTSSQGNEEANAQIESIARILLERQDRIKAGGDVNPN